MCNITSFLSMHNMNVLHDLIVNLKILDLFFIQFYFTHIHTHKHTPRKVNFQQKQRSFTVNLVINEQATYLLIQTIPDSFFLLLYFKHNK